MSTNTVASQQVTRFTLGRVLAWILLAILILPQGAARLGLQ